MVRYQFTIFCADGKYKPISTILECKSDGDYLANQREYKKRAVAKICAQRNITPQWLRKYNYTQMAVRFYDPQAIEQQKRERYEQIKKERGWA